MKRLLLLLAFGSALVVGLVTAEDPPKAAPPAVAAEAETPKTDGDVAAEVVAASESLDADALADIAAKLSSDSRSPVKSDAVYRLAMKAAAAKKDVKAMDKLDAELAKSTIPTAKKLATELKSLRSLAMKVRAAGDAPLVSIDELTPETVENYQTFKMNIESARVHGDATRLKELGSILPTVPELPAKVQEYLKKKLADAETNLGEVDESMVVLKKLSAANRATGAGTLAIEIFPDGRKVTLPPNTYVNIPAGVILDSPTSISTINVTTTVVTIRTPPPQTARRSGTPNSFVMSCPGLPLALVIDGKRIQFGTAIAAEFSTRYKTVTSAEYHRYPGLAELRAKCPVIGATGFPACFHDTVKGVKVAVDDFGPVTRNGSTTTFISATAFNKVPNVATLRINR